MPFPGKRRGRAEGAPVAESATTTSSSAARIKRLEKREEENTEETQKCVQKFLARADKILAAVDEAYIITHRNHQQRLVPLFTLEEVSIGDLLGTGGFGQVYEINHFTLQNNSKNQQNETTSKTEVAAVETIVNGNCDNRNNGKKEQPNATNGTNSIKMNGAVHGNSPTLVSDALNHMDGNNDYNEDDDDEEYDYTRRGFGPSSSTATILTTNITNSNDPTGNNINSNGQQQQQPQNGTYILQTNTNMNEDDTDHVHYDITQARKWMAREPRRDGYGRYAIKKLKENLSELEQARAMVDLAVEAKFLSIVWHPNIIKIRGLSKGNLIDKNNFIVLDRLRTTLEQEMKTWIEMEKKFKGKCFGCIARNKKGLHDLLVTRMTVAYDLASAFYYLHENRLVYRDIKPENVGFDFRGDVKVFDFGLCKSLSPKLKANNLQYGYKLTGRAGSLPYMAPEVVQMKTYDTKCDVFSFAVLLWEILSLQQAFNDMKAGVFVEKVIMQKERLPVNKKWPPLTRLMIPEAWDDDPRIRPDMQRVAILIRGDLNLMTDDETILRRTKHLNNRSAHSIRRLEEDEGQ